MFEEIEERLREVGEDRVSGASKIFSKTLSILRDLYKSNPGKESLERVYSMLKTIHPTMAPIRLLEKIVEESLRGRISPGDVLECVEKLERSKRECVEKTSRLLGELIPFKAKIATLSFSSHVYNALKYLKERVEEVKISESTPGSEGLILARDLEKEGIKTKVYSDSAMARMVEESDLILLGVDSIMLEGGVVNKLGSYTMTVLANYYAKPIYYLAEPFKILPHQNRSSKNTSISWVRSGVFEYIPPTLNYHIVICGVMLKPNPKDISRVYRGFLETVGLRALINHC